VIGWNNNIVIKHIYKLKLPVIKDLMREAFEVLLNGLNITILEAHTSALARIDHAQG
jgi:hypothetical protein